MGGAQHKICYSAINSGFTQKKLANTAFLRNNDIKSYPEIVIEHLDLWKCMLDVQRNVQIR